MTAYASNATGNWSTTTIWTPNGTPGNGDTISIGAGHTVTMNGSRTIGTSPVAGTTVVSIANTGKLIVDSGTLTLRGDCAITQGEGIAISAGAGIEFDASAAASPSTTYYKIQIGGTHFEAWIKLNGTSASRCFIRSNSGGGNGYTTGSGFLSSGLFRGGYCDFTRVGDATRHAMQPSPSGSGTIFSLNDCVFDACGDIYKEFATNADATYSLVNVTFKNTVSSQCLQLENTNAKTTGTRVISGCVFDKICYFYYNAGFVISNTLFYQGLAASFGVAQQASISNCFIRSQVGLGDEIVLSGDLSDSYHYFDTTNINPHFWNVLTTGQNQSVTDNVFEASNSAANCEGDCLIVGAPGSASTLTVTGNVIIPNAGNITTGTLFTSGAAGGSNVTIIANHNTVHSGGAPGVQQGAAVGETYIGHTGMISSFKNNIFWTAGTTGGYKLYDSGADDVVSDLVTSANANYNCGYNLSAGSNLKGYDKLQFSSGSPGANDIDVDPQFVDSTRDLAKWSASLGGAGTAADAIAELSKRNTTGYNSAYTIAALVLYVREGFVIQNSLLHNTGSDGTDIGAMGYLAPPVVSVNNWCASYGFSSVGAVGAALPPPQISDFWANNGEDKVTQDEMRGSISNSVWNATTKEISIFGAKNEVVNFNLVLESAAGGTNISVEFDTLTGPGGYLIQTTQSSDLFNYVGRNIELFYVRYLQIQGLSLLSYEEYDERHVPIRMRRGWSGPGTPSGTWYDRPDHDKYYPDIAVPLELHPTFNIAAGENQSIWCDIFIPKTATAGTYTGNLLIKENGSTQFIVPVTLEVRAITLPDVPSAKTMLYYSYPNINARYIAGANYPTSLAEETTSIAIQDEHFKMAHRHKMSLIDDNDGYAALPSPETPRPAWTRRLDGSLFTSGNGYDGPGISTGNNVFSIGTYGDSGWQAVQATMNSQSNSYADYFATNAPTADFFLYLIDEPGAGSYSNIETWSGWLNSNPGSGSAVESFVTISALISQTSTPALDISCTACMSFIGTVANWNTAQAYYQGAGKALWGYNGHRPQAGSFAIEDDGVALRCLAWAQYKKEIGRWFYYETTYYNDYQNGRGQTNVFQNAQIFGGTPAFDSIKGMTSAGYSNGDGLLFYPGTDRVYPAENYGIDGPIASLRLKHWRRGIQDVDYITLAAAIDSVATQAIVDALIPQVLWEYGVTDPGDPTYVLTDISWSVDPDDWESARLALADIIDP